jgi:hypothetical protein
MKRITILSIGIYGLLLSGCATTEYYGPASASTDGAALMARICIVRDFRLLDSFRRIPIYDDGHCVGELGFNKPLCWERPVGPASISMPIREKLGTDSQYIAPVVYDAGTAKRSIQIQADGTVKLALRSWTNPNFYVEYTFVLLNSERERQ